MNGKTYSRAGGIGKNFLNILKRLHRDFTLGYFGNNISTAQKEYRKFINLLVNEEYSGGDCYHRDFNTASIYLCRRKLVRGTHWHRFRTPGIELFIGCTG
jgi:hypothetical protein